MAKRYSLFLLACMVFLLSSCNGTDSSSTSPTPTTEAPIQSDPLVVKRLDPLHQTKLTFEKHIEDKNQALEVYNKLQSLPSFPKGIISCPPDNGVQYELSFRLENGTESRALVNATGCEKVTMSNNEEQTYWMAEPTANEFVALLEDVLGLSDSEFKVGFGA